MYELSVLQFHDDVISPYADLSPLLDRPLDFLNDMLVTPSGDLYVGTRTPGLDPNNPGEPTDAFVYIPPFGQGEQRDYPADTVTIPGTFESNSYTTCGGDFVEN